VKFELIEFEFRFGWHPNIWVWIWILSNSHLKPEHPPEYILNYIIIHILKTMLPNYVIIVLSFVNYVITILTFVNYSPNYATFCILSNRIRVEFRLIINYACSCCGFEFGWKNPNPTDVGFILPYIHVCNIGGVYLLMVF
jgi:hypothetical protein